MFRASAGFDAADFHDWKELDPLLMCFMLKLHLHKLLQTLYKVLTDACGQFQWGGGVVLLQLSKQGKKKPCVGS